MLKPRRMITLLACALLTLPAPAGAQQQADSSPDVPPLYRARNFYFVFKLGTTLPLMVQDTPECAAAQQAVSSGNLMTYSFVSSLDRAALAGALDTFLREHTFQIADLPSGERDGSGSGREDARTLTDPEAPGFSYTVRLHDRPAGASALCVNLRFLAPSSSRTSPPSQETS